MVLGRRSGSRAKRETIRDTPHRRNAGKRYPLVSHKAFHTVIHYSHHISLRRRYDRGLGATPGAGQSRERLNNDRSNTADRRKLEDERPCRIVGRT